jgi:hypothetical protein
MTPAGGGIRLSGGSAAQNLTSTPAQATCWNSGGANAQQSSISEGDYSVAGDFANNRCLLFAPGYYFVFGQLSASAGGTANVTGTCYLNGVAQGELSGEMAVTGTTVGSLSFCGVLNVPRSAALAGTQPAQAQLDLRLSASSNIALTPLSGTLGAIRLE